MSKKEPKVEESDRFAGAGIGGALLGASIGGPIGAVVFGVIGLVLANIAIEEEKKAGKK